MPESHRSRGFRLPFHIGQGWLAYDAEKPSGKTRDDRGGRRGHKRSRDEEDDSGRVSCPLCEKAGHVVEDCWYQYPEKAPAFFKPTKSTQGLVAANLKADPSLGGGSKKVKQS